MQGHGGSPTEQRPENKSVSQNLGQVFDPLAHTPSPTVGRGHEVGLRTRSRAHLQEGGMGKMGGICHNRPGCIAWLNLRSAAG